MSRSVLNALRRWEVWGIAGIVLFVGGLSGIGVWRGWSVVTHLLVVVGGLVVCTILVGIQWLRARRSAQRIEQSIQMQAQDQRREAQGDRRAEIDELRDRLKDAIATLNESELGGEGWGRNALYALPWYMMIGPPGAGKTTAIKHSGLDFPVGTEGIKGVGGTRNCDWFFSDEAILLDTAGRYMTETEDETEWHAFLDMLKEHRPHRPINGVIVGISVDELVDATPDEIEWHADNIRRRIGELVQRLEVRFPVYVMFTKCDLLQGFVDFFGDLSRREREQILGCTLPDEQRAEEEPRAVFEEEYDRLHEALLEVRTDRLRRSMKPDTRRRAFLFPLEFASARAPLGLFVEHLFRTHPYHEQPEFRGFYFTSGTQEGTPIDRVIRAVAEPFDLGGPVEAGREPGTDTKSYFLKTLFTDAIIPDRDRVVKTARSRRRSRWAQWATGAVCAGLLGGFVLWGGRALMQSKAALEQVEQVARAADSARWNSRSGAQALVAVDRLREEVDRLENRDASPPLLGWGLSRSGTVLGPARTVYFRTMRPFVRAQFQALERRLRQRVTSGAQGQDRHAMREDLRAYLLLSEEAGRLSDQQERAFLRRHLTRVAVAGAGPTGRSLADRSGQVEAQIDRYVRGLSRKRVSPFEARSALVQRVRRRIYRQPSVETLYASIRRDGARSLDSLRIGEILRSRGGGAIFRGRAVISTLFTKRGWNGFVQERIETAAENPTSGDWVLGESASERSDAAPSPEVLARQLRRRYFRDYASAWKDFLRSVDVASPDGLRQTARTLRRLGDPYNSPVLYLLARVSKETRFSAPWAEQAAEGVPEQAESTVRSRTRPAGEAVPGGADSVAHPVTRQFRGLHRLRVEKAASGGASAALTQSLRALERTGRMADDLVDAPGRAPKVAATVLTGGGVLRDALTTVRTRLRPIDAAVRRTVFERILKSTWEEVLAVAQEQLNDRWRRTVYRPFRRTLDGRYPFATGTQRAPLADVERIFAPQNGTLSTFESEVLAPFLRDNRRRPKTWEGHGIQLSKEALRFFESADRIGEALFSGGSLQVRFDVTPELPAVPDAAPSPSQVFLRVHGTAQTYRMGYRPTTTMRWPGDRGARLLLRTQDGEIGPKREEGAWAWFRLLDDAEVEPRSPNEYRVHWTFQWRGQNQIVTRYTLRWEAPRALVTDPSSFFRLRVPKTLN